MYFKLGIYFSIFLLSLTFSSENIIATSVEPILITISSDMENVVFDGKWTNFSEWKPSSYNLFNFNNGEMILHLRTAHYGDYIYVFVDPVSDDILDEKIDEATICFDGKNEKNISHDSNDFCFSVLFGNESGNVYQGTPIDENGSYLKKIPKPDNLIAISTISDENDRYTKTPHPSYEFKIPIEILNRSDNYGFYLSVYDASINKYFTWPENSTTNSSDIPSPSKWGDLISPDKSLPELHWPILLFSMMFFIILIIPSKIRFGTL